MYIKFSADSKTVLHCHCRSSSDQNVAALADNCPMVFFQSDAVSLLEKDNEYKDEHFDFIQQHIRKFCLKCILLLFI